MTNRVGSQKIEERRVNPPVKPEWPQYTDWHAAPRNNALMIIIPLLGFALAMMLIIVFAAVLQGTPAGNLDGAASHTPAKPARMAVFVL